MSLQAAQASCLEIIYCASKTTSIFAWCLPQINLAVQGPVTGFMCFEVFALRLCIVDVYAWDVVVWQITTSAL